MISAGLLLAAVGILGLLDAWEALPGAYESWPGWITPIEAAAVALSAICFAAMLILGRAPIVGWAAAWSLACAAITVQAIVLDAPVPLLEVHAPAFVPLDWLRGVSDDLRVWFIPAAVAYLLAALLLLYVWRSLRRDAPTSTARHRPAVHNAGGLLLEVLGVANVYGALSLIPFLRFGDLEVLNWPFALAGVVGLPVGVAIAVGGHRVRYGAANRVAVGAMAAVAALVPLVWLLGYSPLAALSPWLAWGLAGLPYVPAPLIVMMMWMGDFEANWLPGARTIAITSGLFALSAGLILAPRAWTFGPRALR